MSYRVRKKKNSSGSVGIQIIDRKNREYRVVETNRFFQRGKTQSSTNSIEPSEKISEKMVK